MKNGEQLEGEKASEHVNSIIIQKAFTIDDCLSALGLPRDVNADLCVCLPPLSIVLSSLLSL